MGKVACRTKIGVQRQIIIHHFKDQPIGHEDFIRALQRSFDIVGVTGDQSYLEALSMGKIPVRDDLKHKKSFDKSIKQFIKGNFDDKPNTPLLKLFYNIESGGLDRKHLVIEELPRIKQEMKLVEDKLRTEFDPKQRVKRAVSKVLEKILGEFYSKSRQ
jgi:hypothetical protein